MAKMYGLDMLFRSIPESYKKGKKKNYKVGDICVYQNRIVGDLFLPLIIRIKEIVCLEYGVYKSDVWFAEEMVGMEKIFPVYSYDREIHYFDLRPATKEEIELLGDEISCCL